MSTHTELPYGSYERWRAAQAEARKLVRDGRDREAARLLVNDGLDEYEAAREVADMREAWRAMRRVLAA
jgi:uncharacterized membrane protein